MLQEKKLGMMTWQCTGRYLSDGCYIWHDLTINIILCIAIVCRSWSSMNLLFSCSSTPNKASSEKIFLYRCTRVVSWLCTCPKPVSHVQTSAAAPHALRTFHVSLPNQCDPFMSALTTQPSKHYIGTNTCQQMPQTRKVCEGSYVLFSTNFVW